MQSPNVAIAQSSVRHFTVQSQSVAIAQFSVRRSAVAARGGSYLQHGCVLQARAFGRLSVKIVFILVFSQIVPFISTYILAAAP